jgi:hypothetical protein
MPDTLLRESNAIWICRYICIAKMGLCHTHGFIYTLDSWTGNKLSCWVLKHMLQTPIYSGSTGSSEASKPIVKQQHLINWIHPLIVDQIFFSGLPSLFEKKKKSFSTSFGWYEVDVCRSPKVDVHPSELDFYLPTLELELPLLQMQ